MIKTKICKTCSKDKLLTEYYKHSTGIGKRAAHCKICSTLRVRSRAAVYYQQHKEEIKAKVKVHREKNVEKAIVYSKQYYADHREQMLADNKIYAQQHQEQIKARYHRNKKQAWPKIRTYYKNKLATDIEFRLVHNLACAVRRVLKGISKSATTEKLISCTTEQLIQHLENQFWPGMTWDNYGDWHIDHIIPISSYNDLSDPEQQQECFKYTNLQPLWAEDNMRKCDKLNYVFEEKEINSGLSPE